MNKLDFKNGKFEMLKEENLFKDGCGNMESEEVTAAGAVLSETSLREAHRKVMEEPVINPFEAGIMAHLEEMEGDEENEIKPAPHAEIDIIKNTDNQMFLKVKKHGWQELTVANQIYILQKIIENLEALEA